MTRGIWSPTEHPADFDRNPDVSTNDIYAMLGGEMLPRDIEVRRRREEHSARLADFRKNYGAYFEGNTTRALLQIIRDIRFGAALIDGLGEVWLNDQEEAALRSELAKRPHIPNKKEARALRQAQAKARHGQAKGRNR